MTAPAFVSVQAVRDILALESNSTSRYSDATIGSNIRAASNFLERRTGRWLWGRTGETITLTTEGKASVLIPGLRTPTAVTLAGATLTLDTTYWLLPDAMQTGLYTGIQLRSHGRGVSSPEWFDRNLDHPYWQTHRMGSLPNDLVIVGDWGFVAGTEPEEVLHATKVLAAFYTKRGDALLSGAFNTEEGSGFDLAALPVEVSAFVSDWAVRPMIASVGGGW